jgi:hypothetical protein
MARGLLMVGTAVVLAATTNWSYRVQAQPPRGEASSTWASRSDPGSIVLDGSIKAGLKQVGPDEAGLAIKGFYLKPEQVDGSKHPAHRVWACGMTLEIDTSRYPDLRSYLDKGLATGYLKSGEARIEMKGLLANAAVTDKVNGHQCVVFQVTEFKPFWEPKVTPENPEANAEHNVVKPIAGVAARAPAPTYQDAALAEQIKKSGGLTVSFRPDQKSVDAVVSSITRAGLKIVNSKPSTGLIHADVLRADQIDPAWIAALRSSPGQPTIEARLNSKIQTRPTVSIPSSEVPSAIDRGRP